MKTKQKKKRGLNAKRYTLNATQRGFTLIEILVATTLFSVVMIISIGAIISINDSNKKAQLTRTVINNLNFAMENMARNLRIGITYHCDYTVGNVASARDCLSGANSIALEGYKGDVNNGSDQIVYRLNTSTRQIERSTNSGAGGTFIPITSPELSIDSLQFYVTGATSGDGKQPRVVISISGSAIFKNVIKSNFTIQTAVSQRKLDS